MSQLAGFYELPKGFKTPQFSDLVFEFVSKGRDDRR